MVAENRTFTQAELQIVLRLAARLQAGVTVGSAPGELASAIAELFPDETFSTDLSRYIDFGDQPRLGPDTPEGRAVLGLQRLVSRVHYLLGATGLPSELTAPIA